MSDVPCNHCGLYYTHRNSCITLIEPTKLRMRDLENRQINEPIIFELLSENKKLKEELSKSKFIIDELMKKDVSILAMDYISDGFEIHYGEKIEKLKEQLAKAVEVIRYSESQFRYIYNVSNGVDVSECAAYSGKKAREFLKTLEEK